MSLTTPAGWLDPCLNVLRNQSSTALTLPFDPSQIVGWARLELRVG